MNIGGLVIMGKREAYTTIAERLTPNPAEQRLTLYVLLGYVVVLVVGRL